MIKKLEIPKELKSDIKAIIVNKSGEKIYEIINDNTPIPINSITKTIISLLVGIAIKEKLFISVNQALPYFESEVSIRELLTMSSGMEWEEKYLFETDNWIKRIESCSIVEENRGKFKYNGGASHMLGKAITDVSGMSLEDFAVKYLFTPLEIDFGAYSKDLEPVEYDLSTIKWKSYRAWDLDPQGYNIGSFSLRMKARDLLKIGELLVSYGNWNGKQIIEKSYIEDMMNPHIRAKNRGFYGFHGWYKKIRNKNVFSGIGINNQYFTLVPEDGLIIIFLTESVKRINQKNDAHTSMEKMYVNLLMKML